MGRLLKTKVNLNILNINKQFDAIQRLNLQVVNIHIPHGLEYLYIIYFVCSISIFIAPPRVIALQPRHWRQKVGKLFSRRHNSLLCIHGRPRL